MNDMSIKQIADYLNINKLKVYRFIKNNNIEATSMRGATQLYNEKICNTIIEYFKKDNYVETFHDIIGNVENSTSETSLKQFDMYQTVSNEMNLKRFDTTNETVLKQFDTINETLLKQIDILSEQLKNKDDQLLEKDKQIAALTNTIQSLTDTLSITQQSLQTEQALHAGTIKKQLTDTSGSGTEKKQNILKKLFVKKR